MAKPLPGEIDVFLRRQAGVISRTQALAEGLTRHGLEERLASGRWQRLQRGVYAAHSGRPGRAAVMWAAVLSARPGAVLCHQSAAELYGLLDPREGRAVHVMLPRGRSASPMKGVVIHYSRRAVLARHPVLEPPRTRLEDTVLDLAEAAARAERATGWILEACASRQTTPDRLLTAMRSRPRMHQRMLLLAALGDARAGVASILEHGYLYRVERPHALPQANRQRPTQLAGARRYEDVRYEEYGVIVELDGQTAHPDGERWRDTRRDNASAASGLRTLRYSYADVMQRPCEVADEIARTLREGGWPGVARRCGPSCTPGDPSVLADAVGLG
jgi:hypothetical protein